MHEWYTLLQNGRVVFRRAAFRDVVGQLKLGVYAVRTDEKWLVPDNADLLHAVRGDSFCWLYSGHYLSGSKGLVPLERWLLNWITLLLLFPQVGRCLSRWSG